MLSQFGRATILEVQQFCVFWLKKNLGEEIVEESNSEYEIKNDLLYLLLRSKQRFEKPKFLLIKKRFFPKTILNYWILKKKRRSLS